MVDEQKILIPLSISELLSTHKSRPDALLCAGNTFLLTSSYARVESKHRDLISLHAVEDLKRIAKTDIMIDIGAMTTLDRLLHADKTLLPQGFGRIIEQTVPYPVRSLATLGGNISITHELLNIYPVLVAWDARFELRKLGATRIISAKDYVSNFGELILEPGEILTRIRIPLGRWTGVYYEKIDSENTDYLPTCAFIGNFRLGKQVIEELRLTCALSNLNYSFNSDFDTEFIGQRLPLSDKAIEDYSQNFIIANDTLKLYNNVILNRRMKGMVKYFLKTLNLSY